MTTRPPRYFRIVPLLCLLSALPLPAGAEEAGKTAAPQAARALQEGLPVLAVEFDSYGLRDKKHLVLAAWPDGTIIWRVPGKKEEKAAYKIGRTDAAKIAGFLARMEKEGVFKKGDDFLNQVGPDASFHRIHLSKGKQHVALVSWHEVYEESPKVVATAHGLVYLQEGDTREKIAKEYHTPDYEAFRKLWRELRNFADGLIPKEGEDYAGPLDFKYPD